MGYINAYLERDVRDLINVRDEMKFYNFMVACAARSGLLFNASDVASVAEVDHKTAKAWLSVLQVSGIVFWFYRDQRKREIDLVIQEGRVLHPVPVWVI